MVKRKTCEILLIESREKERSYYPAIADFLRARFQREIVTGDLKSDFISCGIVDMRSGIVRLISSMSLNRKEELETYVQKTRSLFVDIVGMVYNQKAIKHSFLICEVKLGEINLTDLAQLLGYCVASNTRHGILISIGKNITRGFESIIKANHQVIDLKRADGFRHSLSIATWKDNEMLFDNLGYARTAEIIARDMIRSVS